MRGLSRTGAVQMNRRGVPEAVAQVKSILQHSSTPRGKGYYITEQNCPNVYAHLLE